MKQVIQLDSDSEEVLEDNSNLPLQSLNRSQQEKAEVATTKIILCQESLDKKWQIDGRLIGCSELLSQLQVEEGEQLLTFYLSDTLKIQEQHLKVIETFYLKHKFDRRSIAIGKITYEGYKKVLDPISRHFFENHIKKYSFQDAKHLFDICEYLKFNDLKQLIAVYIASHHFCFFNEKIMEEKIEQSEAYFSRQEEINLQLQLKRYASELSSDILQKTREKYNREFNRQQQG